MCLIVFFNAVFSQSTSKICTLIRFTLFSNMGLLSQIQAVVLLPYRFTLFSNRTAAEEKCQTVLLPYRFTLFSNDLNILVWLHRVLLPYRFTLFSNLKLGIKCTHYTVHGKSIRIFYNTCIMIVNKIRINHYQSQQGVPCCNPALMFS